MSELVEKTVEMLPEKWAKRGLIALLGILTLIAVWSYTNLTSWAEHLSQADASFIAKNASQDIDIAKLVVATENTNESVKALTLALERQSDKRDERARRMDRLLDILEQTSYTKPKKESE